MDLNVEDLTLNDLKTLLRDIIEKEDSNIKHSLFTPIEYYKSPVFNKKMKLYGSLAPIKSLKMILKPYLTKGFYDPNTKNVCVFFRIQKKVNIFKGKNKICDLLRCVYHELEHVKQYGDSISKENITYNIIKNARIDDFESFALTIEYLSKLKPFDYSFHHDEYLSEALAHSRGNQRTEEYLKQYPSLYEKCKDYMALRKKQSEYFYRNYDFQTFFENFNSVFKKNNYIPYSNTWLAIFYNMNSEFNSLSKIMNHQRFKDVNDKIKYSILSSKSFIKQLDFTSLNKDELELIHQSLQYTYNSEIERRKYNNKAYQEGIIDSTGWLKSDEKIVGKMRYYQEQLIQFKRNSYRRLNQNKMKKYYDKLPNLIEEINTQKSRK